MLPKSFTDMILDNQNSRHIKDNINLLFEYRNEKIYYTSNSSNGFLFIALDGYDFIPLHLNGSHCKYTVELYLEDNSDITIKQLNSIIDNITFDTPPIISIHNIKTKLNDDIVTNKVKLDSFIFKASQILHTGLIHINTKTLQFAGGTIDNITDLIGEYKEVTLMDCETLDKTMNPTSALSCDKLITVFCDFDEIRDFNADIKKELSISSSSINKITGDIPKNTMIHQNMGIIDISNCEDIDNLTFKEVAFHTNVKKLMVNSRLSKIIWNNPNPQDMKIFILNGWCYLYDEYTIKKKNTKLLDYIAELKNTVLMIDMNSEEMSKFVNSLDMIKDNIIDSIEKKAKNSRFNNFQSYIKFHTVKTQKIESTQTTVVLNYESGIMLQLTDNNKVIKKNSFLKYYSERLFGTMLTYYDIVSRTPELLQRNKYLSDKIRVTPIEVIKNVTNMEEIKTSIFNIASDFFSAEYIGYTFFKATFDNSQVYTCFVSTQRKNEITVIEYFKDI
jgi:hypothetical protein